MILPVRTGAAVLFTCLLVTAGRADDWPQFLGPTRNGVSVEQGLAASWPKGGPPLVWQHEVGEGFSGPVIAGDRLILFHRVGNEEVVECLHAATGKPQWKHAYATNYSDALGKGDGPRSTPVIAGKRVITLGAEGMLTCLDLEKGTQLFSRALLKDYRVPPSYFGVATSPVVEGDLVLVNVGGKNAGIVAFALADGKEVWKATDDGPSYSSPIVVTAGQQRVAVFFTRFGADLVDAKTGAVRYRQKCAPATTPRSTPPRRSRSATNSSSRRATRRGAPAQAQIRRQRRGNLAGRGCDGQSLQHRGRS